MKPLRGKSSGFGHPGFDGYIEPWALVCNAFSVENTDLANQEAISRTLLNFDWFTDLSTLGFDARTHQPGRQELRNVVRGGRHAQTHRVD